MQSKAFVPLQWAENLDQMLALSGDRLAYSSSKVHLVGYSMGGYIAALVALAHPQKVASLTLVSSSGKSLASSELAQRKLLLTAIKNKQYKGMTNARIEFMLHKNNASSDNIKHIISDMANDLGPSVLATQTRATTERKNLLNQLGKQAFKTHFIVGEQDNIAPPAEIHLCAAQSKQFSVEVIPEAGHMLPLEQTDALARCLLKKLAN